MGENEFSFMWIQLTFSKVPRRKYRGRTGVRRDNDNDVRTKEDYT